MDKCDFCNKKIHIDNAILCIECGKLYCENLSCIAKHEKQCNGYAPHISEIDDLGYGGEIP